MADIQTSEAHAKFTPVNAGQWIVETGNHGNHTILVQLLVQQLVS
jgi:hypothetical protein